MKNEIIKIAQEVLTEEEINEIVKEKFKKAVSDACDSAFKWGDISNTIEKKLNDVMVPYIENYDFSEYLVKLDTVLTEIINSDNIVANKKILENFKQLTTMEEIKQINITDLFEKWIEYCEKNIETSGLEVNYDDEPYYQSVDAEMEVEEISSSWNSTIRKIVRFKNEHDEDLNIEFEISKYNGTIYKEEDFTISNQGIVDIKSLRYLNEFEVLLHQLIKSGTKIIIDQKYCDSEIRPEAEPEASYS